MPYSPKGGDLLNTYSTAAIMSPPLIRSARESDLPQIHAIFTHFVQHTMINFRHQTTMPDHERAQLQEIQAKGFPYLVAVDGVPSSGETATPIAAEPSTERVLGYANAHPFRGAKEGYAHTVELTIFVRPEATGQGRVGPALMEALLEALRQCGAGEARMGSEEDAPVKGQVKQVLACMSIDDQDVARDAALKRFYERWGFEERGHLKKVGWKHGRWIDTRYMQLSL